METTVYLTPTDDFPHRLKNWWQHLKLKAALQHVSLFIALMTYTVCGGLVFRKLEYPAEVERLTMLNETVHTQRARFVQWIKNNSAMQQFDNSEIQEMELESALNKYENVLQNAVKRGLTNYRDSMEQLERWTILKSVFFSSTVITTIGYGDIVPVTIKGRAFCIVYALIGIPLTLTVIADFGRLFATTVSTLMDHLPPPPKFCRGKNASGARRTSLYALSAVGFLFVYLALGAGLFVIWEDGWTFFDGFYFCFVTMTTIGFGDLVPEKPTYMLFATMYILIGLALTTTIIELVRRQYAQSWRQLQALSGPLADNLRKLAENRPGLDVSAFQQDLRKVLTVVTMPRKFNASQKSKTGKLQPNGDWEEAMEAVIRDITEGNQRQKPPIVQIVIYESSV
ncbi:potassium channel subfamily K member 18-like [Atheta coriaria]|uniref:potassium channel subfamily K member 18-like n=1 Tax=Dalotia coriaria TaxID=877792 RepID=UPI0031F3C2BA